MNRPVISGIQQIGIGVTNAEEAWAWYRKSFGMNVPIFKDSATASLMTRYTSNVAEKRFAILAINQQGGGGFEVWQYTSKTPQPASFSPVLGDTGIFAVKMKTRNIDQAYEHFKSKNIAVLGEPRKAPDGRRHMYLKDPYGNVFEVIESNSWLSIRKNAIGGVAGCVIGVSDIDKALTLYRDLLGYTEIVYDQTSTFSDYQNLDGAGDKYRRVLLRPLEPRMGAFCRLLGHTEIELVETKDRKPRKIFENRNWGDLGFIHVCFDINGMDRLSALCQDSGFPFTVDSRDSFDMGKAAGHFSYCEDPDGTLIEFVETHKIPIIEKIGWFLNIKERDPIKPLPDWMFSMLALNKVKD